MVYRVTDAELQAVLDLIPNAQYGGRPISRSALAYHLGIGLAQVSYRIALLRERGVVLTVGGTVVDRIPLLSSQQGYLLSAEPNHNAEFRGRRSRTALTIFERTYNEAVARFVATLPVADQPATKRKLERTWVRIIEDIGDAVVENNALLASHTF